MPLNASAVKDSVQRIVGSFVDETGLIADSRLDIAVAVKLLQHLHRYFVARVGGKTVAGNVHRDLCRDAGCRPARECRQ